MNPKKASVLGSSILLWGLLACDASYVVQSALNAAMASSAAPIATAAGAAAEPAPIATATGSAVAPAPIPTATTSTATPVPTSTPAPTLSPTPSLPMVTVRVDTNCRTGPGTVYNVVGALLVGQTAQVVGQDGYGTNWIIANPNVPGGTCWLYGAYATVTGDTKTLPVFTPPPTPVLTSDLQVMSLNANSGHVVVQVKNNGPDDFQGTLTVVCTATYFIRGQFPPVPYPTASADKPTVTIADGSSLGINTSLKVVAAFSYPVIHCVVEVPGSIDPNANNNSGNMAIP